MVKCFKNFFDDESGASAIEYALIAALVSVAAVAALTSVGNSLNSIFGIPSNSLSNAANSG